MANNPKSHRHNAITRAAVEIAFIIFLFYANLLMGEYTVTTDTPSKTLLMGVHDMFTYKNFGIALGSALIGYVVFEYLRKKS